MATISTIKTSANIFNSSRTIKKDSNGYLHCVYIRNDGTYDQVYYAKSTNNGSTWTETKISNTTNSTADMLNVQIDIDSNDYIHVLWHHSAQVDHKVYYRKGLTSNWNDFAVGFRCVKDIEEN